MFRPILLAAALTLAAPAIADHLMTPIVQDEYDDMLGEFTPAYRVILSPTVDELDDGGRGQYEYTLTRGATYRFFGVCDEDCDDLDLVVYDARGNRVASDFAMNDRPVVNFTVPRGTSATDYTVEVRMASCSYEPCQFAVGHLRR